MSDAGPGGLRGERARLVANARLGGRGFGESLAELIDATFTRLVETTEITGRWVLVALGSYARRELSPGSDIDVMLLGDGRRGGRLEDAARTVWYPLWDAGFVLGHSVRTMRDAVGIAGADLEAMTALLDARSVTGDRTLAEDLGRRIRRLASKRRDVLITELADAAASRRVEPGAIAEMLEPDLKQGSGGLRDVQALHWIGSTLDEGGPGGLDSLVEHGYLGVDDRSRLASARDRLLDVRLALHRVTGARSDLLTLQEQDAVAEQLGADDADALVRGLAETGRRVGWIAADTWDRLRSTQAGPARRGSRPRDVADGVVVRDGRIAFAPDVEVDPLTVLRAAGAAAELQVPFERSALARGADLAEVSWSAVERSAFVQLLAAGERAVPVFEGLDHVGALTRFLPEWASVRSRPQRNAYHRYTVDRHLLETVAECAALRADDGFDGEVARRCRVDLLLLGALLHDIAKGVPEDHSVVGAETARIVAERMGLDDSGVETLSWLVRHHLLMADTSTRRDLTDETTVLRFGRLVGTAERLDLLYALTVGDSRATGPAAWNPARAALVRELYVRTDALLETGVVDTAGRDRRRDELGALVGAARAGAFLDALPSAYGSTFETPEIARHLGLVDVGAPTVDWRDAGNGRLQVTVVAPDRPGLLATVAGALAVLGIDILEANAFSHAHGLAIETFVGDDRYDRLVDEPARESATKMILAAAAADIDVKSRLRERRERYRRAPGVVTTRVDLDASASATVVEVEAPDEVGLLATVASVFVDLELDVTVAKVQTLGDRVIDVFYVRSADGDKITDRLTLERLRATIVARLTTEYSVP